MSINWMYWFFGTTAHVIDSLHVYIDNTRGLIGSLPFSRSSKAGMEAKSLLVSLEVRPTLGIQGVKEIRGAAPVWLLQDAIMDGV